MSAISLHKTLSLIVPVFNEKTSINIVLDKLSLLEFVDEVIVVDDCSTDGTKKILKTYNHNPKFKLLFLGRNSGKGSAIVKGIELASSKYICIQDADLEYDPKEISILYENAMGDHIVFGSRRKGFSLFSPRQLRSHYFCVTLLNFAVWLLYRVRISDEATCYKLFSRKIALSMNLQCQRFEFCPELISKAIRMGLRFDEHKVSYNPRSKKEGKKIRLKDAFDAFWTLWKYRNWQPTHQHQLELYTTESQEHEMAS